MLRKELLGIALVAVLLAPAAAQAQGYGWGGYRGGFYYGNYASPYYGGWNGYSYSPYYYGPGVYTTPRVYSYQSYYGPTYTPAPTYAQPAAYPQAVAAPVYFNVQVPAEAEVWFGGAKTTQTGPVRRFMTPPLPPGNRYSYDVTATWMDNGQPVTEKRTVTFETGQQSEQTVDLRPSRQ